MCIRDRSLSLCLCLCLSLSVLVRVCSVSAAVHKQESLRLGRISQENQLQMLVGQWRVHTTCRCCAGCYNNYQPVLNWKMAVADRCELVNLLRLHCAD